MKYLIAALAVTAILATSAIAKTQRTNEAHVQPGNSVTHYKQTTNPMWKCVVPHPQTDPDSRIRIQLMRDCKSYESSPNT
jgi:hypothetical protein